MSTRSPANEKARARELPIEEAASASSPFSAVVDETAAEVDDAFVSALAPTG
jgi:hypothetical protein